MNRKVFMAKLALMEFSLLNPMSKESEVILFIKYNYQKPFSHITLRVYKNRVDIIHSDNFTDYKLDNFSDFNKCINKIIAIDKELSKGYGVPI